MELRRTYSTQEGLVRHWADEAVELCRDMEEETLDEYAEPVRVAQKALLHDRRIIAIGGAGSGKSALLAALAGAPCIARHKSANRYVCWRYECRDGDATCSRFLPLPNLLGLELVDTADCAADDTREVCRALLQGADAVVAVVDGRAPGSSPVWELLAELPEKSLSTCLLAVTHTDMIGAEESLKLKDTLRELGRSKLNFPLPPYFVCPGDARGMEVFRSRVQEALQSPTGVRALIRALAERATELVEKQGRVLHMRRSASLMDNGFINGIDQEIDNFLSHQMLGLNTHRENMNAALMQVLPPLLQRVRRHFSHGVSPSTLLRLELLGADTDRALYRQMERKVQHMQAESDRQFTLSCAGHWRAVRPRMKKSIACEIGEFPEEALERDLLDLRKRLCGDLYEPFANTGLRHRLYSLFMAQAGWMRACLFFMCFLLVASGVLGFAGLDAPALCCVASAALVWLGGAIGSRLACRHICREVTALTNELRASMEQTMRGVLERLIVSRVAAYRRLYTAPRQKVNRQNEMLEPLQQRQKDLFLQLRTIIPRL